MKNPIDDIKSNYRQTFSKAASIHRFSKDWPNDKFGVAMTYAQISNAARQADRDTLAFTGVEIPVRDSATKTCLRSAHDLTSQRIGTRRSFAGARRCGR